jgi:hypothetical protein
VFLRFQGAKQRETRDVIERERGWKSKRERERTSKHDSEVVVV